MDFVSNFVELLRDGPPYNLEQGQAARLMELAAALTLNAAGQGQPITDTLTRNQLGAVIAALMINQNPNIRRAINNGEKA